jgi:hypothetical protein
MYFIFKKIKPDFNRITMQCKVIVSNLKLTYRLIQISSGQLSPIFLKPYQANSRVDSFEV